MIMVGQKEFQRNAPKYMRQLPILLTRHGKVIAIVQDEQTAKRWLEEKLGEDDEKEQ